MLNDDTDDEDDPFDDSHRPAQPQQQQRQQQPVPLAAPRPGYAAPIAALNLSPPSPAASPVRRTPSPQHPRPLMLVNNMNNPGSPRMASPGLNVPATPHPLPPTITPITPVFVRPTKADESREVKFAASAPILRSDKEETLLPQRGERGDDFWRRFSVVVKQERMTPSAQKTR